MVGLALETATALGSVAVGDADGVRAEFQVGHRRHAAAAAPAVEAVLHAAGVELADLDTVVFGDGPGSFTGLRIGWATLLGLVGAREDVRVLAVPSLAAAAWSVAAAAGGPVAALYDALRGEVYGAVYDPSRGFEVLAAPTRTTVTKLAAAVPGVACAVGDGAVAHGDEVRRWTGRAPVGPPAGAPRATGLLALAALPGVPVAVPDLAVFTPVYGRPAEAQARWEEAHGRPLPDSPGHPR